MSGWRERLVSAAQRARMAELVRDEPEARVLALILGEPKVWEWVLSIGTLRDAGLRALAPPLPPEALRRITADEAPETFLWTGLVDVEGLLALYHRHRDARPRGEAPPARPRLLDFGCGCGRLLRFLTAHEDLLELHGCDTNAELVAWCRANLAPIAFAHNLSRPPLPYADASFDGIWSLSVFTHLDDRHAAEWRDELARLLAPGGLLIATTHGRTALARIAAEPELAARFRFDRARLAELEHALASRGSAFVPYDDDVRAAAGAGESYGSTFVSPEHVASRWAGGPWRLLEHLPGALRGWQDVVVLERGAG